MTTTPTKLIVNCETGEVQQLPLTKEEIAERELLAAQTKAEREAAEAEAARIAALKVSAKQKLVAGEPLTSEEAAVLVA